MEVNYTPAPDEITKKYGLISSALFGRIWRYSQGPHGYCWASQKTLGKALGVSDRTVRNHLPELLESGLIVKFNGEFGPGYKPAKHWRFISNFEAEKDSGRKEIPTTEELDSAIERKEIPTKKEVKKEDKKELSSLEKFEKIHGKFSAKELEAGYGDMLSDLRFKIGKETFEEILLWSAGLENKRRGSIVKSMCTAAENWGKQDNKNETSGGWFAD